MFKSDLPSLTPFDYGSANELRTECWKALEFSVLYPNSAAKITAFFAGLGAVGDGIPMLGDVVAITTEQGIRPPAVGNYGAPVDVAGTDYPSVVLPDGYLVLQDSDAFVLKNSAGTAAVGAGANLSIVNDVPSIVLDPNTAYLVNGKVLTGVAPTGTYTSSIAFTVAGGVITGIALS